MIEGTQAVRVVGILILEILSAIQFYYFQWGILYLLGFPTYS